MRDKRFIAQHRGGLLPPAQHKQLILWTCQCTEHVLHLLDAAPDACILHAMTVARQWAAGDVPTGLAMKASLAAHAAARAATNPIAEAIARSAGQAVATAHMADHSLGGALYALKAIKLAGQSLTTERNWQNTQLPAEIKDLVLDTRSEKEKGLKVYGE